MASEPALDGAPGKPEHILLARLHRLHINRDVRSNRNAVLAGTAGKMGDIGTGHQRLGGRAARIDTRPPEAVPLDNGNALPAFRQPVGERGAGLPRADDDRVEAGHGSTSFASGEARASPRLKRTEMRVRTVAAPSCRARFPPGAARWRARAGSRPRGDRSCLPRVPQRSRPARGGSPPANGARYPPR